MSDIFIDPNGGPLSVKIKVKSLQDVGYDLMFVNNKQNVLADFDGSLSPTADFAINKINNPASECVDGFMNGALEIGDPKGAGNDYDVIISIQQDGNELHPPIEMKGKTTDDEVSLFPQFHINAKP
jgi:hypothetical protein